MRKWKLISKMQVLKIVFLFFIAIILLVSVSGRRYNYLNPRVDDWYRVEDWELDICSKWGGTEEAQSGAQTSSPVYLSRTTLSLQGKKETYNVENATPLYKASWYLEPIKEMSYIVELRGTSSIRKIADGTAKYSEPAQGYYTNYHNEAYTHVKMVYGNEWIIVPIQVEEK